MEMLTLPDPEACMRYYTAIGLVLACQAVASCAEPQAEAVSTKKRIAELVSDLGHAKFAKRLKATELLSGLGEVALPALRAAIRDSESPEVQRRARQVITKILVAAKHSRSSGLEMEVIKAGTFAMGSPSTEPGRRSHERLHPVSLSLTFLLGKYEVTQAQFEKVMQFRPTGYPESDEKAKKRPLAKRGFPVEQVSWYDAVAFCNRLSQQDGFKPCYTLSNLKHKGKSIVSAKVTLHAGNGYRLPTEAEWEYACRAGTKTPYYFGLRNTGKTSNVKASARKGAYGIVSKGWKDYNWPIAVGSYPANPWGLHDMLGNVDEWVGDWYDNEYGRQLPAEKSSAKDPTGPATGRHRVLRGGSWLLTETDARSASRFYQTPDERKNFIGFRVARTP
jgi:formylglycine-generating enzyme required for sulfatase activity